MLYISILLLLADCYQTVQIARHPEKWFETNRILGRHPSVAKVLIYFALCVVGLCVGSIWLGPWLAIAVAILEIAVVSQNYVLGIR